MSIFKLEKVGYHYITGTEVLKDIDYTFEKAKVYAITGKSGTGKSTLLSLMSGLDKPTSGKILYHQEDISKIDEDTYRSHHIGVVFQSFNLLPHLSALENVVLSMDVSGVHIKDKKGEALKLLNEVGLDDQKANRRILKLSGGEQQRVAIARALSYRPDVILADEPTGNLDAHNEEQIMQIFTKLAHEKEKCVIIVTHSSSVSNCADQIYDLQKQREECQ